MPRDESTRDIRPGKWTRRVGSLLWVLLTAAACSVSAADRAKAELADEGIVRCEYGKAGVHPSFAISCHAVEAPAYPPAKVKVVIGGCGSPLERMRLEPPGPFSHALTADISLDASVLRAIGPGRTNDNELEIAHA